MTVSLRIALLMGSAREGRFCEKVTSWVAREIQARGGIEVDVIDPLELDLPRRIERTDGPAVQALCARIERADAYVVVTPEYNHGYPAALKEVIDSAYFEWNAKPVAFVSYGGVSGGLRAVEQLRLVFAELHAMTIRDTLSFANPWKDFDEENELANSVRAQRSLDAMLAGLRWWAAALKSARKAWPYQDRQNVNLSQGCMA